MHPSDRWSLSLIRGCWYLRPTSLPVAALSALVKIFDVFSSFHCFESGDAYEDGGIGAIGPADANEGRFSPTAIRVECWLSNEMAT